MDSSNFDLSDSINFSQNQLDSSTNAHILFDLFCEVTLLSFHPKDGTQKYTPFTCSYILGRYLQSLDGSGG